MKKKPQLCASCGQFKKNITEEHFWPKWLIERTNTDVTGVRSFSGKRIPASALTVPLCRECNYDFGRYLEAPVSRIFDELEGGNGISDFEAELLVRWLWKFEGLSWTLDKPLRSYSPTYTLRERVLFSIDRIRPSLLLAISLIDHIDPSFGDAPLGLDSLNQLNAIFVAGVFSKIAMMVLFQSFVNFVPSEFSCYRLAETLDGASRQKVFFPRTGFENDVDAISVILPAARILSNLHDEWAASWQRLSRA